MEDGGIKEKTAVFLGDSITDCGRTYPQVSEFGRGYAALCIGALREAFPTARLYNRGVAGECIADIYRRWGRDCLSMRPDLVTFLAGVNDVNYADRREGYGWDPQRLTGQLEEMFSAVKRAGAELVILEPFAFHGALYQDAYAPRLCRLREITRSLAARYADAYVRTGIDAARTLDGVHPTEEGHRILFEAWRQAAQGLRFFET